MLKQFDEIKQALDMMDQETDASQRTKSRHLIEYQFRIALDTIASLERSNERLRSHLEQDPEYQKQQVFRSLSSYISVLDRL